MVVGSQEFQLAAQRQRLLIDKAITIQGAIDTATAADLLHDLTNSLFSDADRAAIAMAITTAQTTGAVQAGRQQLQ
eukprot:2192760-Pyramimonas_sp.AAC.1